MNNVKLTGESYDNLYWPSCENVGGRDKELYGTVDDMHRSWTQDLL